MTTLTKTHLITAFIIILSSLVLEIDTLDIAVHDTYFVIGSEVILYSLTLIFLVFAGTYWVSHKLKVELLKWIGWIHYFLTATVVLAIMILIWKLSQPKEYLHDLSVYNEFDKLNSESEMNNWITISVIMALIAQVFFLFNFVRGIVRKM